MSEHKILRAVIVKKGRCKEDGYTEPYARLEDGRVMPIGWNASDPIFEVGTKGTAQYVREPNAGLWHFQPLPDLTGEDERERFRRSIQRSAPWST